MRAVEKALRGFEPNDLNFYQLHAYVSNLWKSVSHDSSKDPQKDNIDNNLVFPNIEIDFCIWCDSNSESEDLGNIYPFLGNSFGLGQGKEDNETWISVVGSLRNERLAISALKNLRNGASSIKNSDLLDCIRAISDSGGLVTQVYRGLDKASLIDHGSVKLNNLIRVKTVSFATLFHEDCLSLSYSSLVFMNMKGNKEAMEKIDSQLIEANNIISHQMNPMIEKASVPIKKMHSNSSLECRPHLTFDSIASNDLIRFNFLSYETPIPENQYGMGYQNMALIIGDVLRKTRELQKEGANNSSINLFFLEEPESYMHPQMQKRFVSILEDVLYGLMTSADSLPMGIQLVMTTHSSFILQGKLDSELSFQSIRYVHFIHGESKGFKIPLSNVKSITDNVFENQEEAQGLKRYIRYQATEIFFADAVIVLEGVSEETLVPYFLQKFSEEENRKHDLSRYFITYFVINGAYAFKYKKLFEELGIPVLILTDCDPKTDSKDIKNPNNHTEREKTTTNPTLINMGLENPCNPNCPGFKEFGLVRVQTQTRESLQSNNQLPSTFEDAIILANAENDSFHAWINQELGCTELDLWKDVSKYLDKISKTGKGKFATDLLVSKESRNLKIPSYIRSGFEFLWEKLKDERDE